MRRLRFRVVQKSLAARKWQRWSRKPCFSDCRTWICHHLLAWALGELSWGWELFSVVPGTRHWAWKIANAWGGDVTSARGKLTSAVVGVSISSSTGSGCGWRCGEQGRGGSFQGLLYGEGSRMLCGPEAALCWCRGPLPRNYKQILPSNKSTLCSGPALPPRLL